MLMLGDVFAIVAALAGICVTSWSLTMMVTTLFPVRTARAQAALVDRPRRAFGVGLMLWLTVGVLSIALLNAPSAPLKGLGWLAALALLATVALGLAGIAGLAGDRLRNLDPVLSAYGAQTRGAAFVIGGAMLPILGWFLVAPVLLIVGLGAGFAALPSRSRAPVGLEATS